MDKHRKKGIGLKDPQFWRTMYKEADKEAEYWKCWSNVYLFLLVIATLVIIYLMAGRG